MLPDLFIDAPDCFLYIGLPAANGEILHHIRTAVLEPIPTAADALSYKATD